jgi:hypothetical protein
VPKRTENLRRRNTPEGGPVTHAPAGAVVDAPEPDARWHPIAHRWYAALAHSGQARFYEPSDWATAAYVAEGMSRSLAAPERISGQMFAAVNSAMSNLLVTEGDRRRVRMELDRQEPEEDAAVIAIESYRDMLG